MWALFAIISSITFGLSAFLMKYNSFKHWSLHDLLFGMYVTGFLGFLIVTLMTGQLAFSLTILVASILLGIGSTFGNLMFMRALSYGPATLTSPLINISAVFIVIMSITVYGERLEVTNIIGIVLILLATGLLPFDPNEKLTIHNKVWYLFICLAALLFFIRNGGLKITEEMGLNNNNLLMYAYLFGAVWWSTYVLNKSKINNSHKERKYGLYLGLFTGIFSFLGMHFYSAALLSGPASIVSPLFVTHTLIVALLSIVLLKEKLTKMQMIALIGVFIGILIVRI